jgi:NAD(P)H-hydrate epimerase
LTQCKSLEIPILHEIEMNGEKLLSSYDLVLDGIFGFSFKPQGGIREPFNSILKLLRENDSKIPIASIDIPSGWDVEQGDTENFGIRPQTLISLTAPKICTKYFNGHHYLGGRFIPP